jgi:hypothetical protein
MIKSIVRTELHTHVYYNHIGGVMISVLASSAVDRGLEPWSGQTKDYEIGICCFSAKHVAFNANLQFFSYIMARTN